MDTETLTEQAEELQEGVLQFISARKKPVEIETCELTNDVWEKVASQKGYAIKINDNILKACLKDNEKYFEVQTLEDVDNKLHKADLGDWLIIGVHGELYACKPDIFDKTYELL
jgi:hypothetical protein